MNVSRWQEMSGSRKQLGAKREAAIVALLTSRSIEEAARSVGIAPRTLFRWLKEPDFDAAYRVAKRAAFGQSIARLHYLTSAAVSTLGKVMFDSATPAATKARTADSILHHASKAIEIEDIETRVAALEQAATSGTPRR